MNLMTRNNNKSRECKSNVNALERYRQNVKLGLLNKKDKRKKKKEMKK